VLQNGVTVNPVIGNNVIMPRKLRPYLAQIAVVFAATFVASKLGDLLHTVNNGGIGPVWPAAGIALGALLLWGYSVWPGIAAGAFLLTYLSPLPHWAAVVYAIGTTVAALIGAYLLRRVAKFDRSLCRLRDALALIVLGAFSSTVSASIGAATLYAAHIRGWSGFRPAWLIYWLGDSTGVLVVTPLVLTLPALFRIRDRNRLTEFVILLLLLMVTSFGAFGLLPLVPGRVHHLAFAVLPFVMWAAIRFGMSATALSILLLATIATVETSLGSGPFTTNTPLMNAVLLDIFFAVVSVTGLTLAAAIAEREQAERQREQLVREQAAKEARLRLSAIVESSDDAIATGTLDGIIVSWNAGAQKIYGYTEAEVVGKPITMLVPPELPDEENKILDKLRAGGRIEHFETIRVTKTGKRINVSLTISPIKDSSGRTVGISGIARDISERKRAEETLREYERAVEAAEEMIAVVDREYRYLIANHQFLKMRNMTREQVVGRFLHEVLNKGFFEAVVKPKLDECFQGKVVRYEMKYAYPELGERDVSVSYFPIEGTTGVDAAACIFQDITARKRLEEELSDMSRKLIESQEQERARIGRELHDDINQRLALLSIELEQLQENPSEIQPRVKELRRQMAEISNDVEALSHDLHSSKLDYLGVVAGMKSWCREFAERQKMEIDFRSDVSGVLPLALGLSLFRVLQEALNNAIKHSGVKRIEVQLREDSGDIHLVIRDLGRGFDVEAASQGKGLGLTSMRERVRLVNGTISIESGPMSGTTIHVRVPLGSEGERQKAAG
jgi:PAS domain S-box-containing protein